MSTAKGNGNGSVPPWMAELGVVDGDYFLESKPSLKRAMRSSCFSGPARLYLWYRLHTMGFQQELAVKMEAGKRVPAQPVDACNETGIGRRHFREYQNVLEGLGLAKSEGWTKGRFLLYSWAVPRAVEVEKIVPRAGTIPSAIPADLASLLGHYRIRFEPGYVPSAGTIEQLAKLARGAKEAELSLRAYAQSLRARDTLNKEERNGKKPLKETGNGGRAGNNGNTPTRPPDALTLGLTERGYAYLLEDENAMKALRADLGDLPLQHYWPVFDERLKRAAKKKEVLGLAILCDKARQARAAYENWKREQTGKQASGELPPPSAGEIAAARETLANANAHKSQHEYARSVLERAGLKEHGRVVTA